MINSYEKFFEMKLLNFQMQQDELNSIPFNHFPFLPYFLFIIVQLIIIIQNSNPY